MKTGAELIAEERLRQISKEGWTAAHDAKHDGGQLVEAALCYAQAAFYSHHFSDWRAKATLYNGGPTSLWPWETEWWKPDDNQLRNLVKAGALIAAEIDRRQTIGRPKISAPMPNSLR